VVLLPQPEVNYAFTGSAGYMFPRADGILLGGTFERGNASLEPDPATAERILASHQQLFAGFRCGQAAG
jgi:glycine/D-amino acid oxidase-like deaminating enzyme